MKAKRLLAIFAAFTMSAAIFAVGCGDGTTDGGDDKDPDTEQGGGNNGGDENEENNGGEDNPPEPGQDTSTKLTGKIYLVGDSTVCSFNDNYYLPRYGYGTQLYNYINCDEDQIVNLALSGRSSKSFLTENNYQTLVNSIGEGDYLIIGFGHNDEKSEEEARFTSPVGDRTVEGSFQKSLYDNYVKLAKDKGATPILCTPIVRYDASGSYSGAKVHNTADGDYSAAIRALGGDTGTTVIDLTEITKTIYMADNAAATYYHAHTTYSGTLPDVTPDGRDDTHINKYGAKMVAYELTQALFDTDCSLKANIKTNTIPPAYENDYADAIKSDYVKPDYAPFNPDNHVANALGDGWYKTVLGDIGGESKISTFTVAKDADGKFTVGNSAAQGKFAGSVDGFAAAFIQIDASKNFTAKATVKVIESGNSNNQSGFGMMLRDDILVDKYDTTLASNFVAAGILKEKATIFSRESGGSINNANSAPSAISDGDTYELEITRVGQTVTVKVGDKTATFTDFDFVARDNNYMYLCLFANRGFVVEFTNVNFEITGEAQGA